MLLKRRLDLDYEQRMSGVPSMVKEGDVQDLERVTSHDETWLAPRASPDVHTG
jgi:transposase